MMEEVQEMMAIKPMTPVNKLICVYSPGYLIEKDRESNPELYKEIEMLPQNQRDAAINAVVAKFVTNGCEVLAVAEDCSDWAKTAKKLWFRPDTLLKAVPVDNDEMFLYINENFVIAIE